MPAPILLSSESHPARAHRLWRRKDADEFTDADREAIRRFLSEAVVDDPRWIGASTGGTADAAALVVAAWPVEHLGADLDAVMTALLNCALSNGSNTKAAAIILFHTLAQLGARGVRSCKSPAASWNEKLRRDDYDQAIRRPQPVRNILKPDLPDENEATKAA
ncbi:hypothetical protein BSZ21_21035 [Bradyrhizobium canariense]|uniref:hypothetical protein n=1 Tax=Bradyrhizobium canariense TaxID=255045 RepID=UPI000A18E0EA|nr:hypothetical protein [Bradyrhizobium canariense]OSI65604.1 hypothetical protein BSZ21_21035 [Bradyrhizobium canariense]